MSITPQIQAMIDLLEQPRLLEEILDISAMSNFETCKLLWSLLIIGLIQPAMAQISTLQMPFEPEITSDIFITDQEAEKPAPWPSDDTPSFAKPPEVETPVEAVIIPHEQFFIPASTEEKIEPPLPYDPLSEETPIETPLQLPVLIPPKPPEVVTQSIDDTAEVISPEIESQPVEVAQEEKIAEQVEAAQQEKIAEQVEAAQQEKIAEQFETTQEEPAEPEKRFSIPSVAEIEGHEMLMASTLAAAPVEVSFSDLAEAAAPVDSTELHSSSYQDHWEESVAAHVKNLNEVHRFLFEMLRMEMGPSISNFLARILNKVSAQYPLVFDGVKMNEYGELDGAALESNINGNLADKYSEAFSFLLDEERRMMQSFLDRKRAEAIENGMNRILEKQKIAT